jgi:hypothetical protein
MNRRPMSQAPRLVLQGVEDDCERLKAVERKLPGQDSNLDKESQNLLCYRYTTG